MRPVLALMLLFGCGPGSSAKGAKGTTSDPVETCTRVADVCRFDGAKLGVCTQDQARGLYCMAQH